MPDRVVTRRAFLDAEWPPSPAMGPGDAFHLGVTGDPRRRHRATGRPTPSGWAWPVLPTSPRSRRPSQADEHRRAQPRRRLPRQQPARPPTAAASSTSSGRRYGTPPGTRRTSPSPGPPAGARGGSPKTRRRGLSTPTARRRGGHPVRRHGRLRARRRGGARVLGAGLGVVVADHRAADRPSPAPGQPRHTTADAAPSRPRRGVRHARPRRSPARLLEHTREQWGDLALALAPAYR